MMRRSYAQTARPRRRPGLQSGLAGTRAEAVTEYAIVLAVIILGIAAVVVLMRGAVGGDVGILLGAKTP